MKPTINDVAKRAGVSKSTVSQFLNKRYSYMSNTTKRRIEKTIKDLKYHPNQIAKSLKQKDTNVIAFICSTLSARFPLELIAVIENYFQKAKYSVIIAKSDDSPDKEKELIESFLARQVDGIIVFPTNENAEYYKDLQEQRVPVVFVDRNVKGVKVPSALLDNLEAGYEATKLLVEKGHRDIAIFSFPMTNGIEGHPDRVSGYKKELTQNNIEINDDNIIISDLKNVKNHLNDLISRTNPPTGIVACNDMLLEEILMWTKDKKVLIPDVFSLVGIDNISAARLFTPEITTLEQPIAEIGTKVSELLLKIIKRDGDVGDLPLVYRYEPKVNDRSSIKRI